MGSHKVCSMGTTNILSLLSILNTVVAQTNKTCGYDVWACGDQCTSPNDACLCGDRGISYDDPDWCCNSGPCERDDSGEAPSIEYYVYDYDEAVIGASCPGTVQSPNTLCHGSCSKATAQWGEGIRRSRLLCDHDKCVEDYYMCSGRNLCEAETALRLCG